MTDAFAGIPARSTQWRAPGRGVDNCLEPSSIEELCSILGEASRERIGLLIVGGGTRLEWANPTEEIGLGLSTLGLTGVDVFEPDEGVLHARAGTRVSEVRAIADESGWELPLDPPGSSSTIGGVIASAATGPRAQTFGRVADAILGLEAVGADGTAMKCGGRVVKNVTGYDMAKLYCGSFGTLGVLTGAWLRLRPKPKKRLALRAPLPREPVGLDACRRLALLTSVRALIWVEGKGSDADEGVYFELGGSDAEVEHDLAAIGACVSTTEIGTERIDALRDARASSQGEPLVLRVRVLGTDCGAMVRRVRESGLAVAADLGLGVVHARGSLESVESLLVLRRAAVELGGFATFEQLPDDWRIGLDVFGGTPETLDLAREIKRRFDPSNILNPGRFQAGS
jgi:glycolate oxidase FAD binding subunit